MGFLKHFLFPVLSFFHANLMFNYVTGNREGFSRDIFQTDLETPIARHLLGALMFCHGGMLVGTIMGIFQEGSHFRGVLLAMEFVLFAGDTYDSIVEGFDPTVLGAMTVLIVFGGVIHAMEPGLLTKDKGKSKTG